MLLTRSFYNPALLRGDLRRCWPLLGGYTLLWLLILPLHLWRRLADEAPEFYQSTIQRILQGAVSASVWINLLRGLFWRRPCFSTCPMPGPPVVCTASP